MLSPLSCPCCCHSFHVGGLDQHNRGPYGRILSVWYASSTYEWQCRGHRNRIHPNFSQKITWGEYRGMLVGSSSNKYIKSQILLGAVRHCHCEHICKWNEGCNPKIRSCSIQSRLFADLVGIQNSL